MSKARRVYIDPIDQAIMDIIVQVKIGNLVNVEETDLKRLIRERRNEAATYTTNKINGKVVELANDPLQSDRDAFNRLIRFVYLQGQDTGLDLINGGYAHNWTGGTHSYNTEYQAAEDAANTANVGGWGACGW